jgi:hypothetical protein
MIDLHVHTNISDGTATPTEVVREAFELGLTALAITDHDSIEGLAEAQQEADRLGVNLIKGIEFSAVIGKGRPIHILGLAIDPTREGFVKPYEAFRSTRAMKLSHVIDNLQKRGLEVSEEILKPYQKSENLDRMAIAKWLVTKGHTKTIKASWVDWLDPIYFEEGELMTPKMAIDTIHAAGGKAFLAHYNFFVGLDGCTDQEALDLLTELKSLGLDGLEYYYPSYTKEEQMKCQHYIETFGFLKSGGTDYHGTNRPHIQLGVGVGDFCVPDEILDSLL